MPRAIIEYLLHYDLRALETPPGVLIPNIKQGCLKTHCRIAQIPLGSRMMQILSFQKSALHNCVWLAGSRLAFISRFCRSTNKAIPGVSTLKSHSRLELGSLCQAKINLPDLL